MLVAQGLNQSYFPAAWLLSCKGGNHFKFLAVKANALVGAVSAFPIEKNGI
jgi:hypothetical protein